MPVPEDVDRELFRPLTPVVPVAVVNELRHFLEPYLKVVFQSVFKQNYFFIATFSLRIDFPSRPQKTSVLYYLHCAPFLCYLLIKMGRETGY